MPHQPEIEKELAAKEAVKFIKDGQTVGLGTGSSAVYAIRAIAERVKEGLRIVGVPTSVSTQKLAESLGIPLIDISEVTVIDLTIDGADEFTPDLMLIKGGGGALLREKIVATLSREEIIITDSSKKVAQLGAFPLPIEVVPFASAYVARQLAKLNGKATIRVKDDAIYRTDQGNYILDTDFGLISDPRKLALDLKQIEGLVCHGLFIDLATKVLMGSEKRVFFLEK